MQLNELIAILEAQAPGHLAEEWDNIGLNVEPEQKDITRVLVALDCTREVAAEAQKIGAQLVLTHHPLFFKPVKHIHHSDPATAAAYALVRAGIGLYAAHTNLDSALGGVNDALSAHIGLEDVRPLLKPCEPLNELNAGPGRIGMLQNVMTLHEFALFVKGALHSAVRYGGAATDTIVRRVAVVGGSGGSFLQEAKAAGADVLLTGELKHDYALAALALNIGVVEAGHHETENLVLAPFIKRLQAAISALQYKVDFVMANTSRAILIAP